MSNQIPKNYFENLPSRIQAKIDDMEDHIADNAPLLSKISKENIYSVPVFYFSELRKNILSRVQKRRTRYFDLRRISIAASISLIMAFGFKQLLNSLPAKEKSLAELEILDYYIENIDELDLALLSELEFNLESNDENMFEVIEEEELEAYLSTVIDEFSVDDLITLEDI